MSRKTLAPAGRPENTEHLPQRLELRAGAGAITLQAQATEGAAEVTPRFTMVAYTGEPMSVEGWR